MMFGGSAVKEMQHDYQKFSTTVATIVLVCLLLSESLFPSQLKICSLPRPFGILSIKASQFVFGIQVRLFPSVASKPAAVPPE